MAHNRRVSRVDLRRDTKRKSSFVGERAQVRGRGPVDTGHPLPRPHVFGAGDSRER